MTEKSGKPGKTQKERKLWKNFWRIFKKKKIGFRKKRTSVTENRPVLR